MNDFEIPAGDEQEAETASGFCGYCGHFVDPIDEPPPETQGDPF